MTQNVGLNSVSYPQRSTRCTRFALELPPMVKTTSMSYSSQMAADTRTTRHAPSAATVWRGPDTSRMHGLMNKLPQTGQLIHLINRELEIIMSGSKSEYFISRRRWKSTIASGASAIAGSAEADLIDLLDGSCSLRKRDCSVGNLHWAPHVLHVESAVWKRDLLEGSQIAASNHR